VERNATPDMALNVPIDNNVNQQPRLNDEMPEQYPNIFYNRSDEPRIRNWANNMLMHLNQLEVSHRRGDLVEVNRLVEVVFKHYHPKSKHEIIIPNVTEHDDDQEQHRFIPELQYPIIKADMKTVVFLL